MNVLSLFDGISCGRVALDRAGINVKNYYASEIDKFAIKVSQKNYPDIVQLGDVTGWRDWSIDWASIDLLIGGSPCQGFSFAGKQLNFNDPRSALFFVFLDILKHIRSFNPDVKFLLENVRMKKEWGDIISQHLNCAPILIDSALVSAQSRKRLYWCSWDVMTMSDDKRLVLRDILVDIPTDWVVGILQRPRGKNKGGLHVDKCPTLLANSGGNKEKKIGIICNVNPSGRGMSGRVASIHGKSPTLTTSEGVKIGDIADDEKLWYRKALPVECERLQTLPDNYTDCVSKTQRYKQLGNGWTVDVVAHIFRGMK